MCYLYHIHGVADLIWKGGISHFLLSNAILLYWSITYLISQSYPTLFIFKLTNISTYATEMFSPQTWISCWVNEWLIDFWKFQLKVTHVNFPETVGLIQMKQFVALTWQTSLIIFSKFHKIATQISVSSFSQFQIINVFCLDSTSQMTAL